LIESATRWSDSEFDGDKAARAEEVISWGVSEITLDSVLSGIQDCLDFASIFDRDSSVKSIISVGCGCNAEESTSLGVVVLVIQR
jgi:hypothetical protein